MELLESETESYPRRYESPPAEEPDDDVSGEDNGDGPGRNWLRLVGLILLAAIIIFLLVLLARWIYHAVSDSGDNGTPQTQQTAPNRPAGNRGGSPSQPGNNPPNNPPDNAGNQNTGKLPNNGPGDVIGLFVGASLAAAGLHFIVSLRRQANSKY